MPHRTPLIATIVAGLVLAFVLGAIANRLRLSPLVGYLLAGVAVGPHTPGFVADQSLATELAEIGVILLMFGVGVHFSLRDLLSVRAIAIPGAIAQIALSTLLGIGLSWAMGWSIGSGFVFGLALSVASTVVLLRSLQERHLLDSERGRIAVGWLIVQDLAMVLALVLLPALSGLLTGGPAASATPGQPGSAERDDRPEPLHRAETRRIVAPGPGRAAPSWSAPVTNRARKTESRSHSVFNRLLQHYLPQADLGLDPIACDRIRMEVDAEAGGIADKNLSVLHHRHAHDKLVP
jgi:hypothetical protein